MQNIDKRKTQQAVESLFEKYRLYKYVGFDKRSAQIVQVLSDMPRGGGTSDQTAEVAVHNASEEQQRKSFCEVIETTVEYLSDVEQDVIKSRYMNKDSDHMTDTKVYTEVLDPPISATHYYKLRWAAIYKVASRLGLCVSAEHKQN